MRGCVACRRAKLPNEKPFGLLQPLEIPKWRWERINVDFIIKLPETTPGELPTYGGNDTFVGVLTKRAREKVSPLSGLPRSSLPPTSACTDFRIPWSRTETPVYRRVLAVPDQALRYPDVDAHSLPPADGWAVHNR